MKSNIFFLLCCFGLFILCQAIETEQNGMSAAFTKNDERPLNTECCDPQCMRYCSGMTCCMDDWCCPYGTVCVARDTCRINQFFN